MLLHPLGQDLILTLQLVLEGGDQLVLGVGAGLAAFAAVLEGSGAVVKELLLPQVEEVDGEVVLLTDVGDWLVLQQMEPEQGHLLFRREVTTLPRHRCSSERVLPLTRSKANS